jgi:hypothetical protein
MEVIAVYRLKTDDIADAADDGADLRLDFLFVCL